MIRKLSSTFHKPTAPRSPKGPPGSPSSSILRSFGPEVVWLTQWYPEATWQIFPFMRPSNLWNKNGVEVEWFHSLCRKSLESFEFLDYWTYIYLSVHVLLCFSNLNSPWNMNITWCHFDWKDRVQTCTNPPPRDFFRLTSLLASRKECSRSVPWPSASPVSWQQEKHQVSQSQPFPDS